MLFFFVLNAVYVIFAKYNFISEMSETIILVGIFIFIVGGFLLLNKFYRNRPVADDHHHDHEGEDGVCCGRHTNCAKGFDNSNLYFDDEELDAFKERKGDDYTEEEIEQFRNVLYTMRPDEIEEWAACLQKRRIEIPQEIKDDILLMLQ